MPHCLTLTSSSHTLRFTKFNDGVKNAVIRTSLAFQNIPAEQIDPLLMAYCPNTLFPYARDVVASTVFRGSFPELNLSPINFDALYWQSKQQNTANQTIN